MLISSAFLAFDNQAYALQELSDSAMSQTDAQDGIHMTTAYDSIDINRVYWQDKVGADTSTEITLGAYFDGVKIQKTGTQDLGATYDIDFGSNGTNAGVTFDLSSYFDTMSVDSFKVCDSTGAGCGATFGAFAVQQSSTLPLTFKLTTADGLLNLASVAGLEIGIKNFNLYFTQKASGPVYNQFIAKDFNFNFKGKGYIGIDAARGIVLETGDDKLPRGAGNYVDLLRVADSNPLYSSRDKAGLNLDFVYKGSATAGVYDTTGARGVLHLGASGRVTNASIEFRGASDTTDSNILGVAYSVLGVASTTQIMGSSGLKMRMKADFVKADNDTSNGLPAGGKGVTLELGHGGTNAYGLEFSNLSPLLIRKTIVAGGGTLNTDRAYFDSGDVYVNLMNSKKVQMPVNTVLNTSRLTVNSVTDVITPTSDYSHIVHNELANPNALAVAVRNFNFNAAARSTRFIASNDVYINNFPNYPTNAAQNWGLGLPIYNLQANVVTYGTTVAGSERLGFALGLSTQGSNSDNNPSTHTDGDKTTSILLIDGAPNCLDGGINCNTTPSGGNPTNYYFGLRNIDMLITAYGTLGLEDNKINLNMPKLTIAGAMELAAGYLPGSKYRSNFTGCTAAEVACYVPVDSFTTKDDVFLGVKLKLDGSMNLDIVPGADTLAGNRLSFEGNYDLKGNVIESGIQYTTSTIQLVDPIDGSIVGFDNITGNIGFNNQIKINKDTVAFNYAITFNPGQVQDKVFRVRDVNLYPPTGNGQRLGEMAITGGRLVSNITLKPRD